MFGWVCGGGCDVRWGDDDEIGGKFQEGRQGAWSGEVAVVPLFNKVLQPHIHSILSPHGASTWCFEPAPDRRCVLLAAPSSSP